MKPMTLHSYAKTGYFFGPAYVADVSPIVAARLLPRLDAPLGVAAWELQRWP